MRGIVRIARVTPAPVLTRRANANLVHVGLAENDGTEFFQAAD